MKKTLLAIMLFAVGISTAQAEWKIAGNKIRTEWAEKVDPANVLPEYPRPQLVRSAWQNLNGLWNYAITEINAAEPSVFDGEILVPFALESALSGVQKPLTEKQLLWYEQVHRSCKMDGTASNASLWCSRLERRCLCKRHLGR